MLWSIYFAWVSLVSAAAQMLTMIHDSLVQAPDQLTNKWDEASRRPGRRQDGYIWLDWISIPQIVNDDTSSDEVSDNNELGSREISGRLRRRSRGLRLSLRSFRARAAMAGLQSVFAAIRLKVLETRSDSLSQH